MTGRQCVGPHNAITLVRCESGVCRPLTCELVSLSVVLYACLLCIFVIGCLVVLQSTMKVFYIVRSALVGVVKSPV